MAFARFGSDSDVYVYDDARGGYTCERCPSVGPHFRCQTTGEMIAHLLEHRARGHRVPQEAILELEREKPLKCDECGSPFIEGTTPMASLCAECAHVLYGYPPCEHVFDLDGGCVKCDWNQARSEYVRRLLEGRHDR